MKKERPVHSGLYREEFEHGSCGIGFVAHIKGKKSHSIIRQGLDVLRNMIHRGAEGADSKSGDGAGIMIQVPRDFYLIQGYPVPPEGQFGTGLVFLPKEKTEADRCIDIFLKTAHEEGVSFLGFREVPRNSDAIGELARAAEPEIIQVMLGADMPREDLERKLYIIRKLSENAVRNSDIGNKSFFCIPSLSTRVLVYKGMFTSTQLSEYYSDLTDERLQSAIALVHSRFSTNTFPSWDLAQPFRMLGHNGEINTIKGNRLWMEARESILKSEKLGDLSRLYPIIEPGKSDSASLDNVLEFLVMSGKSIPYALSILVPESINDKNPMPPDLRAFYKYHSTFMEPWDGPASLIFSDGRYVGGMLDRNGLRPSRYTITHNDLIVLASETGVQTFQPGEIREKGRLKPGKMLLIDTHTGKIYRDDEIKAGLASEYPYAKWIEKNMVKLEKIETAHTENPGMDDLYDNYIKCFSYSPEDTDKIIREMAATGKEPIGSMGNDVPLAILSPRPYRLFSYFKQLFAQVTNPPVDPIREELVMTLSGYLGSLQENLLETTPAHVKMVRFRNPVISNTVFQIVKNLKYKGFSNATLMLHFEASKGTQGLKEAVENLCFEAEKAVDQGKNYIILTDRGITNALAPIPSLMAVSAVHHHLISKRKRMQIDIVVESAEPREVMHFALLFGYGASIINPYMSFAVIDRLIKEKTIQLDYQKAEANYINSINKGLLKIMSKMGISTLRSYRSSQIFEAVGIDNKVIEKYFKGTVSRLGGIGMDEITDEVLIPHRLAFSSETADPGFPNEGIYSYRKNGEHHAWNPETIALLQWSTRTGNYEKFREYSDRVNRDTARPGFIRGLLKLKNNPIPLEEVEPADRIMKRFVTGAMSFGSISREAHETLAIAMNRIGGRSNTGEGGEDPRRFIKLENGDSLRSAIKQVASGRFGVTTEYLVNADELQIKIGQGAKPGEGGQLPGHKVDSIIAGTRYSIPGITLISPPPHHDIYSIEDLSQLIFDLRNVNPGARISVKLVSETGVGTIAAGVTKAGADLITISGYEGGTGASPVSSIKNAGLPLELGLSETQQTLVLNNLRGKVMLQADGQLKTGRDIVVAALLGAEEFGFATSALVVMGCVMMRKCHLNTCPVGVATQNEELRKRFTGKADYLVNFFRFLAEEVRELLAGMGYRKMDEIIGRSDLLERDTAVTNRKISKMNLSQLLALPAEAALYPVRSGLTRNAIGHVTDMDIISEAEPALREKRQVVITRTLYNTDRTVGAMLSGRITMLHGREGLPDNTIRCRFNGSAGQSFGAFLAPGVELYLEGDANDYLGKGLSGGRIIVVPPQGSDFDSDKNIIVGNTVLYGATGGEIYISGVAGERFAVRNSGSIAVVEGVGNHCCEYMTGGRVVVLGSTGNNFGAGMSGGIAYVFNENGDFDFYCNMGMVELSLVEESSDIRELTGLVKRHYDFTGSRKAKMILDDTEKYLPQFIKVIPYDYRKVIQEQKLEELKRKIAGVELDLEITGN